MKIRLSGIAILGLLFCAVSFGFTISEILVDNYKYIIVTQMIVAIGIILCLISVIENEIKLREKR